MTVEIIGFKTKILFDISHMVGQIVVTYIRTKHSVSMAQVRMCVILCFVRKTVQILYL